MDGSRTLPGFEDFDKAEVYKKSEDYVATADALNFAIEYDSDRALVALALDTSSMEELLQAKLASTRTRWINLWCPERQKKTVEALARHYRFSPRLVALMTSDHDKPVVAPMENHESWRTRMHRFKLDRSSFESQAADIEKMQTLNEPASHATTPDLNHYTIVNEVWYFCSVDWGSKCKALQRLRKLRLIKLDLCVGYNSLSQLESDHVDRTQPLDHMPSKPHAKRLWTWLIICDDSLYSSGSLV